MTANYEYKVGGSLGEDTPSYVVRQADSDLYHGLKAGEFCYIFNSRQMGKTSLIVRTMKKLQAEGYACTSLDFSVRGSRDIKSEQWYAGIVYKLITNFSLGNPSEFLRNWWRERSDIPPVQIFEEFIETVVLTSISSKIVIFIDEIDSILSLDFITDDFFALIRSCYEKRNFLPEYQRLTFALVGVATPSDLIADKRRTPFNIGRAIQLNGFKESEIEPLAKGFEGQVVNPLDLMREVLAWTGGQPFLTQKVCRLLATDSDIETRNFASLQDFIEKNIETNIIENWEAHDEPEHLKTIRDRMLLGEQVAGRFLGWYQQILLSGEISADDSAEQMRFRLTGLVVKQQNRLKVYNKIYESVFNLNWVKKELRKLRPYSETFQAWVDSNYQDESRLLRGEALNDALAWAEDKSLSDRDYLFLRDSQGLEKQEIQRARELERLEAEINLDAERKKLEAQSKANKILKTAAEKAKKQIRFGTIILLLSLIIAISVGLWGSNQKLELKAKTTKLDAQTTELEGNIALQQFNFERQEIQALVSAIHAGQGLQNLVNKNTALEKYPATTPMLALQTILNEIREYTQLTGHESWVYSASFSPDGQRLVTASNDKTAKVWDLSGKPLATLKHESRVNSASFSPDGQRLVTASNDKTAKVWDLSGKPLATLKHESGVISASFSPDGQRLITVSSDKTAKVWDLSGKPLATLKHESPVLSASFSPDGQRLVTASYDKTAKVWDLSGKPLATLKHENVVNSASFSPDGQRLVTASYDKTAKVWDLSGKPLATLKHESGVISASFSPDGQRLITVSSDKTAKVWDLSGKPLATLKHESPVLSASFSPDGQRLITVSSDNTAKVWDLSGKPLATLKHENVVNSASFSPDGQRLVTASDDNTAKVWDLSGKPLATLKHENVVNSASFSPDGQRLVTASYDNTAKVWDLSGKPLATLKHENVVNSASFSPDGQRLVTASYDNTAKVWDLSGKPLATLKHESEVRSASFSPDGQRLITVSLDNTAKVWDLSGKPLATLKHESGVLSASFSPDGQRLITVSLDNTAKVWDLSGKPLATLKHESPVLSASFSPDGQRLVTASLDNTAKVWDLSGKPLATLKHENSVNSASFSPDGQRLITVSWDNTAKVWDLSGKPLATLKHENVVNSASFSPDGQRLVTASSFDNTAKVWDLSGKPLATLKHESWVLSASFSPDGQRLVTASGNTVQVWRVENLDQLLVRGCKWLNDYLITHPKDLEKLDVCQNEYNRITAAPFMVIEGEKQAKKGDTDDAVATFHQALKWNSKLKLDPKAKAKQIAEASKLVNQGDNLLLEGNSESAIAVFQKALKLDPNLDIEQKKTKAAEVLLEQGGKLVDEGKIKQAISAYTQAQKLQPKVEISAKYWNSLCLYGSLQKYASDVMYACEKAVALAPDDGEIRDSRGLARVLTSNTNGAIEDFQAFIAQTNNQERKSQRQRWIDALRAGKKPFTDEELKKLLQQ